MPRIGEVEYLTTAEAAKALGLSPGYLRNARCDGREPVPSHKFGAGVFYLRADVDRYVAGPA